MNIILYLHHLWLLYPAPKKVQCASTQKRLYISIIFKWHIAHKMKYLLRLTTSILNHWIHRLPPYTYATNLFFFYPQVSRLLLVSTMFFPSSRPLQSALVHIIMLSFLLICPIFQTFLMLLNIPYRASLPYLLLYSFIWTIAKTFYKHLFFLIIISASCITTTCSLSYLLKPSLTFSPARYSPKTFPTDFFHPSQTVSWNHMPYQRFPKFRVFSCSFSYITSISLFVCLFYPFICFLIIHLLNCHPHGWSVILLHKLLLFTPS